MPASEIDRERSPISPRAFIKFDVLAQPKRVSRWMWIAGLSLSFGCSEPIGRIVGEETINGETYPIDLEPGYLVSSGRMEGTTEDFVHGANVSFQLRYDPGRTTGDIDLSLPEAVTGARASVSEKTDPDIDVGGFVVHPATSGTLRITQLPTASRPTWKGSLLGVTARGTSFDYRIEAEFEITFEPETIETYAVVP